MAQAMVPVQVEQAQLEIDRERVETVVKSELEAREKHGKVAQDFEVAKLKIEAEREVRIATANASATLFQKMEAKLYGTPEDAQKILDSMMRGQSAARTLGGFFEASDGQTDAAIAGITEGVKRLASAVANKEGSLDEPISAEVNLPVDAAE